MNHPTVRRPSLLGEGSSYAGACSVCACLPAQRVAGCQLLHLHPLTLQMQRRGCSSVSLV
eukprot:scaffold156261_cov13-Tisochrysis_lutea.AAC.1